MALVVLSFPGWIIALARSPTTFTLRGSAPAGLPFRPPMGYLSRLTAWTRAITRSSGTDREEPSLCGDTSGSDQWIFTPRRLTRLESINGRQVEYRYVKRLAIKVSPFSQAMRQEVQSSRG